jgi:hypothetical protein
MRQLAPDVENALIGLAILGGVFGFSLATSASDVLSTGAGVILVVATVYRPARRRRVVYLGALVVSVALAILALLVASNLADFVFGALFTVLGLSSLAWMAIATGSRGTALRSRLGLESGSSRSKSHHEAPLWPLYLAARLFGAVSVALFVVWVAFPIPWMVWCVLVAAGACGFFLRQAHDRRDELARRDPGRT